MAIIDYGYYAGEADLIGEVDPVERMMTVKEVAAYLKLNPITVYRYAAQGKIPGFKVGSSWRFKKEILDEWVLNEARRYSSTSA